MRDYSDCYATLGITPDTEWKALRARYRRLIGQWHPDRFSQDTTGRTIAEERSKQITLAYQALERYHRDYGVLPPLGQAAPAPDPIAQKQAPASEPAGSVATEAEVPPEAPARRAPHSLRRFALPLVLLVVAAYVAQRYVDEPEQSNTDAAEETQEAEPAPQRTTPDDLQATGGIRVGLTLGEVYAIQGVPSATRDDTWYYGKSWIRFDRGRVISWEEHVENPLRIDHHRVALQHERLFGVGSTKDEVRAIQGAPVAETANVWYYGPSKIYFEHDSVVRWEESPMQPLRVAR